MPVNPLGTTPDIDWVRIGARFGLLVLTWLLVWLANRFLQQRFTRFLSRVSQVRGEAVDPVVFTGVASLLGVILVLLGAIATVALLNLTSLAVSLLTAAGFVGVVVGFAVKDVAANMISGFFLLIDAPFLVGHVIEVGSTQGTVERVTLRVTRIRTADGLLVTVPNSIVANGAITNYSANPWRRFELPLTLPLQFDAAKASDALLAVARADPRVREDPQPKVIHGSLGERSYRLTLVAVTANSDVAQVQSDLRGQLLRRMQGEMGQLESG